MNKIKECRLKKGFTQEQLAKKLRVNRSTVAKWECGTNMPRAQRLLEISNLFNKKIDYFF